MDKSSNEFGPEKGEIEEAKRNPGGWVYRINGSYGPPEAVPPEAIVGAWKVDGNGNITGELIPNPNFKSRSKQERPESD